MGRQQGVDSLVDSAKGRVELIFQYKYGVNKMVSLNP
jgi:hypothetical protein